MYGFTLRKSLYFEVLTMRLTGSRIYRRSGGAVCYMRTMYLRKKVLNDLISEKENIHHMMLIHNRFCLSLDHVAKGTFLQKVLDEG